MTTRLLLKKTPRAGELARTALHPARSTRAQFLRYLVVGGIAFAVDFACLFLMTDFLGIHYLTSTTAAFVAGLAVNYVLSILWVFDTRRVASRAVEFGLFAAVGILGVGLNDLVMWVLTDLVAFHYLVSKLASTGVVLLWNFGVRKALLFR